MSRTHSIGRAAGVVGFFTLLSRISGLLRDMVMAYAFPKVQTDMFTVAFTIPNVLRYLLAEGSLSISFIPVYTEYRRRDEAQAEEFVRAAFSVTAIVVAGVTALGILAAPLLVTAFAGGFADDATKFAATVELTRILFPYIFFISLMALAMGVLNTLGHFASPAISPMVWNLVCVAAGLAAPALAAASGLPPIHVFAWAVVFGGFLQFAIQLPPMRRRGVRLGFRPHFNHPGVLKMGKLMLPAVFGLAVYQFNVMLSRLFASFLETGALSGLYYAQRLIEFPMGIFAVAIATASMPTLSAHATDGETGKMKETLRNSLEMTFFVLVPSAVALLLLARPVVAVLFQKGHFGPEMTVLTAHALAAFTLGIPSAGLVRNLVPAFYANSETRVPVLAASASLFTYIVIGPLMAWGWGVSGLAVAISLCSWVNAMVLLRLFRRRFGSIGLRATLPAVARMLAAAGLMGISAWAVTLLGRWEHGGSLRNWAVLGLAGTAGVAVYMAAGYGLGLSHPRQLLRRLRRRRA